MVVVWKGWGYLPSPEYSWQIHKRPTAFRGTPLKTQGRVRHTVTAFNFTLNKSKNNQNRLLCATVESGVLVVWRTEEGLLLLASPVDGADLALRAPDAEPPGDQDAAVDVEAEAYVSPPARNRCTRHTYVLRGQTRRASQPTTYSALQSFCQASWYLTGSSWSMPGSRSAESTYWGGGGGPGWGGAGGGGTDG